MAAFRSLLLFSLSLLIWTANSKVTRRNKNVLTNHFHAVFRQPFLTEVEAKAIAEAAGFRVIHRYLQRPNEFLLVHSEVPHQSHRPSEEHREKLAQHVKEVRQSSAHYRHRRGVLRSEDSKWYLNDPLWNASWHLHGGVDGVDLHVESAWNQGVSGAGITIGVVDDGLDYMHPDLAPHFDPWSSYDFNSHDHYPYPLDMGHGTSCAGLAAGARGNGVCTVGVAPNAKIAGMRLLGSPLVSDVMEASALSYSLETIDIYSCSWGPSDNGSTLEGPTHEPARSIQRGITEGRGGKGAIYVWAAGDGGTRDNCNCDGYSSNIYTISINAAFKDGLSPSFNEPCSSILATTFASTPSTSLFGECAKGFSGTSASAPMAAGVFALVLEANSELTWRDVQHLVVLTSRNHKLTDPTGVYQWQKNAAGLDFNHLFGFGTLHAGEIVRLARKWKTLVPPQVVCEVNSTQRELPRMLNMSRITLKQHIRPENCTVRYLEHVTIFMSMKATRRGDLTLQLVSSLGTVSTLLTKRPNDKDNQEGFHDWPFMTTHFWGERTEGEWTLVVGLDSTDPLAHALVTSWRLVLRGTHDPPYAESIREHIPKSVLYL